MNLHTTDLLDDYIANAPVGANSSPPRATQKYHRSFFGSTTDPGAADYYGKESCAPVAAGQRMLDILQ